MQADKLEEHWTPTTIEATFVLRDLPSCTTKSRHISIQLPLLSHGWTFALSLAPEQVETGKTEKVEQRPCKWTPTAFSFRQHDTKTSWGNTSMQARLSLHEVRRSRSVFGSLFDNAFDGLFDDILRSSARSGPVSLGTISVALAHTPSTELPLATSHTLSSNQTTKVSLSVTVSECPLANGLFQTQPLSNTEAQTELFRQNGDRVLNRSLATGKFFDVKFLSSPTRSPFGSTGKLFPTYASLCVLEKYVSLSDSKLADGWTAVFQSNAHDHAHSSQVKEISCPSEYEYELDSDFEDEDSFVVEPSLLSPLDEPSATGDQQLDQSTAGSSRSPSTFDSASDRVSLDDIPEDIVQDSEEESHLFSAAVVDSERTVLIKFAAHRTWHAFLWYCYTSRVDFNGLKSQSPGIRRRRTIHFEDGPPSCSPKSMFRLADLVGNKELKEKCLQAIRERMTEANVLDEIFSIFTSKYPDIRELQLDVLMEYCRSPEVKKAFLKTMMKYNDMPHAEPVLSAFYDQLVA